MVWFEDDAAVIEHTVLLYFFLLCCFHHISVCTNILNKLDGFWGWLIQLWMVVERDIIYYLLLVFGVCVIRLVFVAAFVHVSEVRSCLLSAFRIGGLMWKRLAL
ncbi:hypothetical protein HanLR1_Chr05g0176181 [Helianthus annuus]|nr:hypothetical protein HanLR1_Chr05g0176181 [Helianthus annuus]